MQSPKNPRRPKKPFTGFIVHYENGKTVRERENYISKKLNKQCATNWAEIDKARIVALELIWKDKSKIKLSKEEYPSIKPGDWYFSHTGYLDMKSRKVVVVKRSIGYIKDGLLHIYSVDEKEGSIKGHVRAV
ncbi:MAG: hypothetical protein GF334_06155 [Candidatus Altiarchaeales archaeon]|nr:hypothetical protein [Candidatus Altiarchaeales archaeon]